ncbi:MAG: PAS domain-containing sensor histidine kinase, partial [Paludibacter sp.]
LLGGKLNSSILGKNISGILNPGMDKHFKKAILNVLNRQVEPTFETKLSNLDGKDFDAEITLIYAIYQGAPAVELIINDITERKKAEQLLKLNEARLNEIVATKDKFFSIIAHDLRSPFNSIIGFLDLLENQYDEFDDTERKSYLKLVNENVSKTLKLLDNLLEWAKTQTGKISFQPINQKLLPIVQSVAEPMRSALSLKFLKLKITVPEELEIFADTNMLRTIIRNLISNAIKYSYPEGEISITAKLLDKHVQLTISDTGIGMKEEVLNKIFRIDEQVSVPGTADETGSGLGLILCKDFVKRHNGNISVESEFGKGSRFILQFPLLF